MATIKTAVDIDIAVNGQATVQQAAAAYEDLGDAVSKTQLEAEKLAQQFGINDARTQEAIKVAGKYKNELEQLDFAIDAAKGGSDQLFRASQGVLGGFEAAAGAAALMGVESEDLEATLVKLQGTMALSQGLKDFNEFLPAIKNVASSIKDRLVTAFTSLKGAIAATGIGALAIAVGLLVANFEKVSQAIGLTRKELALTTEEINAQSSESSKAIAQIERLTDAVSNQSLSEKQRVEALKQLKEEYPAYFKNIGDDINDTDALTGAKNKLIDTLIREATVKAAQQKIESVIAEQVNLQIEAQQRYNAGLAEMRRLEKEGETSTVAYANARRAVTYAFSELEEVKEKNKSTLQELNDILNENTIEIEKNGGAVTTAVKKEAVAVKDAGESFDDFVNKLQAFLKYQDAVSFNKMLDTMSQGLDNLTESAELTAKSFENLAGVQIAMPKAAEIQMKTYDKVRAYLYQNQDDIQALGGSISGLFGELGENNKAFALAQVATDTARALAGALANSNSPTPDNIATGGLAGIAKYITLATTILGNAKRARDIIRGNGSVGTPQRATISTAPQINTRQFQTSQLGQDFTGQTKVYVTEGDITRTINRRQTNQRVSVIGG